MVANGYCRSNGHHAFMTKYHQFFIGSLCLFLNLGLLAFVRAQAPVLTINMAYTSIDEKTLYIQGGTDSNSSKTISQFYSLDLTQTGWSTSNPPWKALNSQQAPLDYSHSMVVSGDKQSLIVWGSLTNISTYNISADTWSTTAMPVYATKKLNGLRAVEDPTTGSIYIPSGSNQGLNMMGYSPSQGTFQNLTIPTSLTQGVTHYSAAWTNSGSSFLMYGGYLTIYPNETVTTLYQYSASNSTWTAIVV
ncbi:hypothetical protein BGZ49_004745 [Haplosporangium sp. Z 27]|nr:hypothetical protein BGZ49_004745 [Haplosporangium sp. Z 27]